MSRYCARERASCKKGKIFVPIRFASTKITAGAITRTGWGSATSARATSNSLGTPWAFLTACVVVLVWALSGPLFHFSEIWQLVINTGTTFVTFLMVFLIQNTQNRDARAIHLKLDELIRSIKPARNKLIDLENCSDKDLDEMEHDFDRFRGRRRAAVIAAKDASPIRSD